MWRRNFDTKIIAKWARFMKIEINDGSNSSAWSCLLIYGEPDSTKRLGFYEMIISKIKSFLTLLIVLGIGIIYGSSKTKKGEIEFPWET